MIAECSATQELDFLQDRQFSAKKNRAAVYKSATRNIVDKFPMIYSGRSSDSQIIPVPRLPACLRQWRFTSPAPAYSAGPTLRIFTVFPFHRPCLIGGTRTNMFTQYIIIIKKQIFFCLFWPQRAQRTAFFYIKNPRCILRLFGYFSLIFFNLFES